jgi:hypothetical protein
LEPSQAPVSPPYERLQRNTNTYDYIQELHERAVERRAWLENVDALLRLHGVSLLPPLAVEG